MHPIAEEKERKGALLDGKHKVTIGGVASQLDETWGNGG